VFFAGESLLPGKGRLFCPSDAETKTARWFKSTREVAKKDPALYARTSKSALCGTTSTSVYMPGTPHRVCTGHVLGVLRGVYRVCTLLCTTRPV